MSSNEWYELMELLSGGELEWKDIDLFISEFDYPEGCEAIIDPEGMIAYASPSHVEALIKYSDEKRDVIYDKMPIEEMPIKWLVEYTKCVSVWPNFVILPELVTEDQEMTIKKLIENNLVTMISSDKYPFI